MVMGGAASRACRWSNRNERRNAAEHIDGAAGYGEMNTPHGGAQRHDCETVSTNCTGGTHGTDGTECRATRPEHIDGGRPARLPAEKARLGALRGCNRHRSPRRSARLRHGNAGRSVRVPSRGSVPRRLRVCVTGRQRGRGEAVHGRARRGRDASHCALRSHAPRHARRKVAGNPSGAIHQAEIASPRLGAQAAPT